MTPSHHGGSAARLSDADLEVMLARADEEGARRALSDVGLGGKDAVLTIHDMRSPGTFLGGARQHHLEVGVRQTSGAAAMVRRGHRCSPPVSGEATAAVAASPVWFPRGRD